MIEVEAIVRVDDAGVWLEHSTGRWRLDDDGAETLWKLFADREVIVDGNVHGEEFEIAQLRVARPGALPYQTVGPRRSLTGELVDRIWEAGTRRAGEHERLLRTADGDYPIAHGDVGGGSVDVTARVVEPDPRYAATTGTPALWVLSASALPPPDRG